MNTKKARKPPRGKKYFTVEEANNMLPYLRAILRDVTELAEQIRERQQRLAQLHSPTGTLLDKAHAEEVQNLLDQFEREQDQMREYEDELKNLKVELKDYFSGLIDFPCWKDDREVYLCWKMGEPEVCHWHEIDAGFAGRQILNKEFPF